MKKGFLPFVVALFSIVEIFAQSPRLEWVNAMGGSGGDFGNAITTDESGNIYVAGSFQASVDFDPGADTLILSSTNVLDIFVQKLGSAGNLIWVKSMGSTGTESANSISVDSHGNVYTVGFFENTVDFDPGAGVHNLTALGSFYDIFIQKLDSAGNFLWAKSIGGNALDMAWSVVNDDANNCYVSGYFHSTVDFDPGPNTLNLTAVGDQDGFVLKMDSMGNTVWAKSFGGLDEEYIYSTTIDPCGGVYTTGGFESTVDFDPGVGVANETSQGFDDIFIQKLDSNGNFVWIKTMQGTGPSYGLSIDADNYGNVYSTGMFTGTVNFDPSSPNSSISANNADIFVQKLDFAGNLVWVKSIGGNDLDYGYSVAVSEQNEIYLTGGFESSVDFDPDTTQSFFKNSNGGEDLFVEKLDSNGNFIWVSTAGSALDDRGSSITAGSSGGVFTTGFFSMTPDFDPNASIVTRTSNGWEDIFVQRVGQCFSDVTIDTISACGSYTWIDSVTYTTSNNTATHILTNASGCDSVITLSLTITNIDTSVQIIGNELVSGDSLGDYQWLSCDSAGSAYTPILFTNSRSYIPPIDGYFAVRIFRNGCTDTSRCISYSTVGIRDYEGSKLVQIYPNPSGGEVKIELDHSLHAHEVIILNSLGQRVFALKDHYGPFQIDLKRPGVYTLIVYSDTGPISVKMIRY